MKSPKKTIRKEDISEKRFRALIENAHDGIVLYDENGLIQYAAPSVKKITGYSLQETLGKSWKGFVHEDDHAETKKAVQTIFERSGKSITLLQRVRHKKGHYIWIESRLTNSSHVRGIDGIVSNFRDITEKRVAEEQARRTQGLLETINHNLTEGVYIGVIGSRYLHVNDAFLKTLGYKSFKELEHVKPADLYADNAQRQKIVSELRKKSKLRNIEAEFLRKNGERFWGLLNVSLVREKGKEEYFVGTVRDISKEKADAQQLIDSRNFLNSIINTVATPIFVKDSRHRWIMFNDPFCKLIGRSRKDLLGKTDSDFLTQKESKIFWKTDNEVLQTGKTITNEERITVDKKTHHLFTVKSRTINEKGERFVIGFITDVTEFKKVETELNQLNAALQGVMESTHESIFALDKNFCYTSFNENHQRMTKLLYHADIEVGTDKRRVMKGTKDEKWLMADLRKAMKGKHFVSERKLDYPQYHDRYVELTYNPICDKKGAIEGVAVFVSDITERKQTEARLRTLNDELTRQNWQLASQEEELKTTLDELSERNFELDQLMYKTSHDLRSPLSSIMGLINLVNADTDIANQRQYLQKIEDRIKKLDEFIRSMLNYARANRADVTITKINLEALIRTCIHELEYLDNFKDVETSIEVINPKIAFRSDALRLTIIFGNIISNAYKYYNADVESFLKIRIEITPVAATVEFTDNGIGVKSEHQSKIFNMFYRATDRSQGSGLGMYIVKQAVEKLDGSVKLSSEYGKGTAITITLPNM